MRNPFSIFFILVLLTVNTPALSKEIVIIANNGVPELTLEKTVIKDIFTGRKTRWSDDSRIRIIENRQDEVNELFLREYVGKTVLQFRLYWRNQLFKGMGNIPLHADTNSSLIDMVKKTEGAVGYIDKDAATPDVKIIQVK